MSAIQPVPAVDEKNISASAYIATFNGEPHPDRVVVGAAIAGPGNSNPSVLIVQRAAHERSYPNEWEIPGGHVDEDETILETVRREVKEETGLEVTNIMDEFEGFHYWATKYEDGQSENPEDRTPSACTHQLNFCVSVRDTSAITLCPDEHQAYTWCTYDSIDSFKMTPTMRKVIKDALDVLSKSL